MNKVAELTAIRTFTLAERDLPDPGPGEVQVRVAAVGICGSDMHSFAEGSVGDQICKYPVVLGHEPSGVVEKIGPGVTGFSKGDEAALEPAIYCYHCEFCLSGRHNVCANIRFLSSGADPGFFRERVNLPAQNLLPLGPGLGLREGTLIEPLAIALHSLKFSPPRLGDHVAVFGAGPIGLTTIAALKLAGVARIWAVDPVASRRDMALAMGAHAVVDPSATDPVKEIHHDTGQRGADAVYDCAAKGDSINQSIAVARNAGCVILTGIHAEVLVPFHVHAMRRKEVTVFNTRRSNHDSHLARTMLVNHSKLFAPLITHTRPMDRIKQAFDLVESYADGVGKMLVVPG